MVYCANFAIRNSAKRIITYDMTIAQLEYMVAVANHGSFTAAARHCCITQPSMSVQIQSLEEELGITLFDRRAKPIVPTKDGVRLVEQARNVIAEFNAMKERLDSLKGSLSGKLSIAVVPTVAPYVLPRWIPVFIEQYPDVELELCDMLPTDIPDALDRDLIDIAIVSGGKLPEVYREQKLFVDKFYVYLSPGHELGDRTVVYEHDLDFGKLVFMTEGLAQRTKRREIQEARANMKQHYSFRNTSLETLMRLVDNTPGGAAVIPGMAVDYVPAERRGQVKTFANAGAQRTITLAVGRTCAKQGLIEAVRKSIIATSEQYALADLNRA